jgi:hypothetical protein
MDAREVRGQAGRDQLPGLKLTERGPNEQLSSLELSRHCERPVLALVFGATSENNGGAKPLFTGRQSVAWTCR